MSILLTVALTAATAAAVPDCSWDHPGRDRYTGTTEAAVDRYTDIPAAVRAALKQRMQEHRYDDVATIRRDSIDGRQRYASELRDMHFGSGRVCASVSRSAWADSHVERGLVYCEGAHCLIVPAVCGNVSRIRRAGAAVAGRNDGAGAADAGGAGPAVAAALPQSAGDAADAANGANAADAAPAFDAGPGAGATTTALGDGASFATAAAPSGVASPGGLVAAAGGGGVVPSLRADNVSSALRAGTAIEQGPVAAVPEPGTWALWLGGGALLAWRARRRRGGAGRG